MTVVVDYFDGILSNRKDIVDIDILLVELQLGVLPPVPPHLG